MGATLPYHITSTGNVGPPNGGAIYSVTLSGGAGAGTLTLKENGAGGATILILGAPITDSRQAHYSGMGYSGQLHATISGTGATATIEL